MSETEKAKLPEGWRWVRLKDISLNIQYGYTKSSTKENIGPKFLRITDIQENRVYWESVPYCRISNENLEKYLLKEGDLVFARTGATVGKSFLLHGEMPKSVFASYLIRVRVSKEISDKFLSLFFQSPSYWTQITEGQVGIGQPNVNGTKLGELDLPLPPKGVQYSIVSKLEELFSELDKGVESLRTAQRQLETYRQAVLKWAFEGRLTGGNFESGELPEGWKLKKLGEICLTTSGGTPSRRQPSYYKGNIPWVKSGELDKGTIVDTEEKITDEALENSSAKIFPKGTLLIALYGATIGKLAFLGINAATNQAICGIYQNENILSKYLYNFLIFKRQNLIDQGIGGAQPNISQTILKGLLIPLPPKDEQYKIVQEIEARLTVVDKTEETISQVLKQTETLRRGILKQAFEGNFV